MRIMLDRLYFLSGILAAFFMASIAVLVLSQTIGRQLGVVIPSANTLAGFCVSASTFLGLAPTLNRGGHIRVRMLIEHLPGALHKIFEVWCLGAGTAMSGYATWWSINLVYGSISYGDVSPGLLAIPMWIPQLGMAIGLSIFTICLLDNLIRVLTGSSAAYRDHEDGEI